MNLYNQNPAAWNKLAAAGRTALVEMAKHFVSARDMDEALGAVCATNHWMAARNGASMAYERRARAWVAAHGATPAQQALAVAPQEPSEAVFMVVCPKDKVGLLERVLRALACEVVEL